MRLKNYALGQWIGGEGDGQPLFNSVTGETIAEVSSARA